MNNIKDALLPNTFTSAQKQSWAKTEETVFCSPEQLNMTLEQAAAAE